MDTILRVAIVYFFLIFALRVMGKREFSEFSPMELIVLLLIPELFQESIIGQDTSLANALIGASTLLLLVFGTSALSHLSPKVEKVVESSPTVLAHQGKLIERNMRRERITPEELYSEIRGSGLERLDQVRWAILESNGKISVVPNK